MINVSAIEFHSLMDNEELLAMQRNDASMHELRDYLNDKDSDKMKSVHKPFRKYIDKLSLNREGIIVYTHHDAEKVLAPSRFRKDILHMCHSSYLSGHQGIYKTHQRVLTRFCWPNLFNDVITILKQCDLCQRTKS